MFSALTGILLRSGLLLSWALYPVHYLLFFNNKRYIDSRPADALIIIILCNVMTIIAIVGGAFTALWVGVGAGINIFAVTLLFSYLLIPVVTWIILNLRR
ncbi:MAG: hypothetical protein HYT12_00220 [Candidatus Liptonbacteria bacterium]|nr:hypothetical protein [Candidatus Liptonbacteria bacterium]